MMTKIKQKRQRQQKIVGKKKLKEHYAKKNVVEKYEQMRFQDSNGQLKHVLETDIIKRVIEKEKPKHVLEVAIGPGRMTKELVKLPSIKITAIDYSLPMLQE